MKRLLFVACAAVFLDVLFFAALTPLLPDYRDAHGLSEAATGMLSGSYAAGTLLMALPAGWFVARAGPRSSLLAGLVGIGLFSPVFGFADQIWLLDVSRFFQGASGALLWAGSMSWVISVGAAEESGALVGALVGTAVVGELLGAPIGALAHEIGTEAVFGSVLIAAALLFALALTLEPVRYAEPQSVEDAIAKLREASLWPAVSLLSAASFAIGLALVVAPLRMHDLGASAALIAIAFASGSVTEAAVGPLIGRYSDRAGRIGPYVLGVAIVGTAIAVIGFFHLLGVVFFAVVCIAFGSGLAFTPSITLVTDVARDSGLNQGYAAGASNVAWGGGQMVGAFGGGLLAGIGLPLACLAAVAVLALAAAVARQVDERLPVGST